MAEDPNLLKTSNLPMRLVKVLLGHGFKYVADFAEMSDKKILALDGVGELYLRQIRFALHEIKWNRGDKDNAWKAIIDEAIER